MNQVHSHRPIANWNEIHRANLIMISEGKI